MRGKPLFILEKLEKKGVNVVNMIESALILYTPYDEVDINKTREEIEKRLKKIIMEQCEDINVQVLIAAAIYLDGEIEKGTFGINGDPAILLSDELIGINIAEYIAGKKALFNFIRYDTKKPGILSELNVFLDDAIGGLIAGCMTKLFEDWK